MKLVEDRTAPAVEAGARGGLWRARRRVLAALIAALLVATAQVPLTANHPLGSAAAQTEHDRCPYGYAQTHTVFFGRGAGSEVPNREVGAGCTVMDLIMGGGPYVGHTQFVSHVIIRSTLARLLGAVTPAEQVAIVAASGRSPIGRPMSAAADRDVAGTRIGVVLYTVRETMQTDPAGTLDALAACGIEVVEPSGRADDLYGLRADELAAQITRAGLVAPSVGVTLDDLRERMEAVIDTAQTLGADYVRVSGSDTWTLDDYIEVAGELNRLGAQLNAHDLTLGYHNHGWELEATPEGPRGLDLLVRRTNPALVTFELDIYWAQSAGASSVDLFWTYPGRFALLHLKDLARDETGAPSFADLGRGALDLDRILASASRGGVVYAFIEHDRPTPDGVSSACASMDHLRSLLGS